LYLADHSCQLTADSGIPNVVPLPFSLPQGSSTWKWWHLTAKVGISLVCLLQALVVLSVAGLWKRNNIGEQSRCEFTLAG
jgi:hypothetical protein